MKTMLLQFMNLVNLWCIYLYIYFCSEEAAHAGTMQTKSSFVVGRDRELKAILDYVTGGKIDSGFSSRCSEEEEEDSSDDNKQRELLEEGMFFNKIWSGTSLFT